MSEKERPLPKPPAKPFGKRRFPIEDDERGPLMADEMAMAAAEGRLDDFLKEKFPDNEHARNLAMMMMGMTGIIPQAAANRKAAESEQAGDTLSGDSSEGTPKSPSQPPEDIMQAALAGDVHQLMEFLKCEHQKRTGSDISPPPPPAQEPGLNAAPSVVEKEVLDRMLEIAGANSVTLDWLILRAMKVYIEEYRKTGRL